MALVRAISIISMAAMLSLNTTSSLCREKADSIRTRSGETFTTRSDIDKQRKNRPIIALALGGGGARGAAHVGVLQVLEEEKIPIDMIVGTSMGAVVGGFYCADIPLSRIEAMFRTGKLMRAFMTVPLMVRIIQAPFILVLPRAIYHPYDGLYFGNRFRKYINKQLPNDEKNIEDLHHKFAAVAVDLTQGKVHRLTKGNLSYALQASAAIPGLRKPVQIENRLYVDGGVLENVPVKSARKLGADIVIAVNVDARFEELPLEHFRKMGSVSKRIVTLQLHKMDEPHIPQACVVIHPEMTDIGILSRSKKDAARAIEAGRRAAQHALPQIRMCVRGAQKAIAK